jgi:hypothetical protein
MGIRQPATDWPATFPEGRYDGQRLRVHAYFHNRAASERFLSSFSVKGVQ